MTRIENEELIIDEPEMVESIMRIAALRGITPEQQVKDMLLKAETEGLADKS